MPQKVKETKHTVQDNGLQTLSRVMQVLFALVQILLVFRLAFKLLGANASNVFVNLIYSTTAPLVGLFEGIFADVNLENNALAVFEPATVIAIIVTAAVSYIVLRMLSVKQDKKVEHVEVQEQANAIPLGQVSEAQLKQNSERPVAQPSERPQEQTSERQQEQIDKNKLENESQELEEKIRQQEQMLEHQRKTYGTAHDENKSQELEERIRHQEQVLEDQRKTYATAQVENEQELEGRIRHQEPIFEDQSKAYGTAHDESELDEDSSNINDEIPVYEKRSREI